MEIPESCQAINIWFPVQGELSSSWSYAQTMAHGPNPFFMVSIIALVNRFCGIFHDILSFIFLLISIVHLMSETLHLFMHHVHFKSTPPLLCILQALNWNDSNKHVILSENVSQTCDNTSYSCFMFLYCHVCLSIFYHRLLYPRPTKLEGGYTGFTLSVRLSVCPSVRLSVDDMVSGA